jgi:adenine-specific DNA-methyltransferase
MSIDDNEVHNLRKICDEIFGEDNFVSSLIWRRRKTQANLTKNIAPVHDFILAYAKNKDLLSFNKLSYSNEFIAKTFKNPDNDSRGSYQTRPLAQPATSSNPSYEIELPNGRKITSKWSCSKETFNKYIKTNKLYIPSNGNGMPRLKIFLNESDGMLANTWLDNLSTTEEGSKIIQELFDGKQPFDFPKPIKLIMFLLNLNMGKDDVVLDFFS